MADDVVIPWVASSSTTMVSHMQGKHVRVFHEEGFQLPVTYQCYEMKKKYIYFYDYHTT